MKFVCCSFVSVVLVFGVLLIVVMFVLVQIVGKDYMLIFLVQLIDDVGKVEVFEFFSYGCLYCSDFNLLVMVWVVKLLGDVVFKKVLIIFGCVVWVNIFKFYFILEIIGDLVWFEVDVFKVIYQECVNFFDECMLIEWVVKKGVDVKKFIDIFNFFGVMSKVKCVDQQVQVYKIQGVLVLVVDGKYMVGGKDFNEQLVIVDKLVVKVCSEKFGKK